MQAAAASGDFERCIQLRGQIKTAKISALEAEMQAAVAASDFEKCIQLRQQIAELQ